MVYEDIITIVSANSCNLYLYVEDSVFIMRHTTWQQQHIEDNDITAHSNCDRFWRSRATSSIATFIHCAACSASQIHVCVSAALVKQDCKGGHVRGVAMQRRLG